MTTATGVRYLWQQGDDTTPPEVPQPTSLPCNAETPEDIDWRICDRYKGHDGPHAQWHFVTGELLAAWVDDLTPADPELAAEG